MKAEKNIKVVAFDCDGVMFDTVNANKAFYNQILSYFSKPELTAAQFTYAQMHTAEESIDFLFPDLQEREQAQAYRKNMDILPFITGMEMDPDLIPLLQRLKKNFRLAVATNRTNTMAYILEVFKLEAHFDLVVCAHQAARPKPYPDMLHQIMAHFAIKPHEMLFVGDSELDEQAAKAAQAPLIACRNSSLASAAYHIQRLAEIETIAERH